MHEKKEDGPANKSIQFDLIWRLTSAHSSSYVSAYIVTSILFAEILIYLLCDFYLSFDAPDSAFGLIARGVSQISTQNLAEAGATVYNLLRSLLIMLSYAYFIGFMILVVTSKTISAKTKWLERIIKYFHAYYSAVLFYPTARVFFGDLVCKKQILVSLGETCMQGEHLIFSIFEAFGLLFCVYLTIVKYWYSVDSYYDKNALAGPKRSLEICMSAMRFSIVILISVGNAQNMTFMLIYLCVALAFSIGLVIIFIYTIPYSKTRVEYLCFSWIIVLFGESLTFAVYSIGTLAGYAELTVSINFLLALIVAFPSLLMIYLERKRRLLMRSMTEIESIEEMNRQIRVLLRISSEESAYSEVIVRGIIRNHIEKCLRTSCFCQQPELYDSKKKISVSIEKWFTRRGIVMKHYIRAMFEEKIKHQPKSAALELAYAEFLFHKFHNTHYALIYTTNVAKYVSQNQYIGVRYRMYKLQYLISNFSHLRNAETFINVLEIERVIYVEDQFKSTIALTLDLIKALSAFWEYLLNKSVNLNDMMANSEDVMKKIEATNKLWNPLKPYLPKQKKLKFFYYWYQRDLLNRKLILNEDDYENLAQDDHLSIESTKDFDSFQDDQIVFQDDSAVIHISGEGFNLGRIMRANDNTSRVFGYNEKEVIGSNISLLMPKMIGSQHNKYIIDFVQTAKTRVLYAQKMTFAKHKLGHIFPLWIIVKQECDVSGRVTYAGLLRPITKSQKEEEQYILMNSFGEIGGISKHLSEELNITSQMIDQAPINILMFAPRLIKWLAFSHMVQDSENPAAQSPNSERTWTPRIKEDVLRRQNSSTSQNSENYSTEHQKTKANIPKFEILQNADGIPTKKSAFHNNMDDSETSSHRKRSTNEKAVFIEKNPREISWKQLLDLDGKKENDELDNESDDDDKNKDPRANSQADLDKNSDSFFYFLIRVPVNVEKFAHSFDTERRKVAKQKQMKHIFHPAATNFKLFKEDSLASESSQLVHKAPNRIPSSPESPKSRGWEVALGAVSQLEGYLQSLKHTAMQIIQNPQEKIIIRAKAAVVTEHYGSENDVIKYIKIISFKKLKQRVPNVVNLPLLKLESGGHIQIRKTLRKDSAVSSNNDSPRQNSPELIRLVSYDKQSAGFGNFAENLIPVDIFEEAKLQEHPKIEQQSVIQKSEALENKLVQLKTNVLSHRQNLFEKDETFLISRDHRKLTVLKWLLRLFFLTLIPINIFSCLIASNNKINETQLLMDTSVLSLKVALSYLSAHDNIVTLTLLNGGGYNSILNQQQQNDLVASELQSLNESLTYIKATLTNQTFMNILYTDYVVRNLSADEITENQSQIQTMTFLNTSGASGLDDHTDALFFRITSLLFELSQLDSSAITNSSNLVAYFCQEDVKNLLMDFYEFAVDGFSNFKQTAESSQRVIIYYMIIAMAFLLILLAISSRSVMLIIDIFHTILEMFSFVHESSVREVLTHYTKLFTDFSTISGVSSEAMKVSVLQKLDAKNGKKHTIRHKKLTSSSFLRPLKVRLIVEIALVVLLGFIFSSIPFIASIIFLNHMNTLGMGMQQFSSTAFGLPLLQTSLKQILLNESLYSEGIYPYIQANIEDLATITELSSLQDTSFNFSQRYNTMMKISVCQAFSDKLDATQMSSCKNAVLDRLDKGLIVYGSYFKGTALDALNLNQVEAVRDGMNIETVNENDQAMQVVNLVTSLLISEFQEEFGENYSGVLNQVNWLLAVTSVLILINLILAERLIYVKLYRKFRFLQNFYNKYMIAEALQKEKRIKGILVKKKVLT